MAEIMTYKGYPIVKDANKIYMGEPYDKCIVVLTVLENADMAGEKVPSRILVQLQSTDPALALKPEKIMEQVERKTLADAFNIGQVWLAKHLQ